MVAEVANKYEEVSPVERLSAELKSLFMTLSTKCSPISAREPRRGRRRSSPSPGLVPHGRPVRIQPPRILRQPTHECHPKAGDRAVHRVQRQLLRGELGEDVDQLRVGPCVARRSTGPCLAPLLGAAHPRSPFSPEAVSTRGRTVATHGAFLEGPGAGAQPPGGARGAGPVLRGVARVVAPGAAGPASGTAEGAPREAARGESASWHARCSTGRHHPQSPRDTQ